MAEDVRIELNESAVRQVLNSPECVAWTGEQARLLASRASTMGAGFRTQPYTRSDGTQVGNTAPRFRGDARRGAKGAVGLVWCDNYAAMVFDARNDALLKARG